MKRASGSGLFLLETMISIMFFLIAAAVCVQIFAQAHQISKEAGNITHAQANASNAAELINGASDPAKALEQLYGFVVTEGSRIRVCFNEAWEPCRETEACFIMNMELGQEDGMQMGEISVQALPGEELYYLRTEHYQQHTISTRK